MLHWKCQRSAASPFQAQQGRGRIPSPYWGNHQRKEPCTPTPKGHSKAPKCLAVTPAVCDPGPAEPQLWPQDTEQCDTAEGRLQSDSADGLGGGTPRWVEEDFTMPLANCKALLTCPAEKWSDGEILTLLLLS